MGPDRNEVQGVEPDGIVTRWGRGGARQKQGPDWGLGWGMVRQEWGPDEGQEWDQRGGKPRWG